MNQEDWKDDRLDMMIPKLLLRVLCVFCILRSIKIMFSLFVNFFLHSRLMMILKLLLCVLCAFCILRCIKIMFSLFMNFFLHSRLMSHLD